MSTSQTPPGAHPGSGSVAGTGAGAAPSGDPSMEDILASIRRILSEDEVAAPGATPPAPPVVALEDKAASDVLVLDPAMMVSDPPASSIAVPEPAAPVAPRAPAFASQNLVAPEAAA